MSTPRRKDLDSASYRKNRETFLTEWDGACHWCKRARATTIDHVIEQDRGADPTDQSNWVGACHKCNSRRGAEYLAKKRAATVQARTKIQNTNQKSKNQNNFFEIEKTFTPTPSMHLSQKAEKAPDMAGSRRMVSDAPGPGMIEPRLMSGLLGCGSYVDEVAALAHDVMNIDLMPWQKLALRGQLEHDENGDLVRRRSLVSVARQNGKTVALKAFILWALTKEPIRRGKPVLVISTAHQLDLAVEIFEQLAPLLEAKFGAKAYWSYGRNEVVMPDESRWLVQAATPKAFHGFSPTYIVADEVWNISADVLFNGALPSQRAMQSPLLSCWSTAGTEDSHAMLKMREEGLRAIDEKKFSKLFFAEWSVPPGVDPMVEKGYWAMANPAIGYTLDPEILVDESEQVDKAAFMRASLNLWISSANSWLNPGVFDKLTTSAMPEGGVLAVDSSIDESLYCGIRAQLNDEGQIAVTVEFVTDTLGACWEKVHESAKTCRQIALTPSLFQMAPMDIDKKKIDVGYGELVTHTSTIRQLINEGRLVHTGEQMLLEHVNRAVGVKTQSGYTISSQKSSGPITMARCMIFAAALVAKPTQKARAAIAFGR
jgi:phage terminase large subunit-like protein